MCDPFITDSVGIRLKQETFAELIDLFAKKSNEVFYLYDSRGYVIT